MLETTPPPSAAFSNTPPLQRLARFAGVLVEEGASILDISHDRAFAAEDISTVAVHCVVETRDAEHITALRERLSREGFKLA